MKKVFLFLSALLVVSACKKDEQTCGDGLMNQDETAVDCGGVCTPCPIEYPANGHYGVNILDESTTKFYLAPDYSLHAILPAGNSINIVFTNTSSNVNSELWFYNPGSGVNLIISNYNESTGVQTFESTAGALEIDVRMSFGGSGSATVDIYENEATMPTRTKYITW